MGAGCRVQGAAGTISLMPDALRQDLQRLLDDVDAIDAAVGTLSSQVSDTQFFWQPHEGRAWSIAQCLEHLAMSNKVYGAAIREGIERARARGLTGGGAIYSNVLGRKFITSLEPPVVRRMRNPRKSTPPGSSDRGEILRSFAEGHDLVRELIRSAAAIDVNRAVFKNPFLPLVRVRVGTGLRIISAHDRRHIWQAENVRKAPGFPSGR